MVDRFSRLSLWNVKRDLEYEKQRLEARHKNMNWHEFSKVNRKDTNSKDFLITPTKGYNLKRNTGFTPRLLDFLREANGNQLKFKKFLAYYLLPN